MHRTALAALDEAAQRARVVLFSLLPPAPFHYRLHVVKKFLGDDGLMFAFVKLFVVAEQSVVKRIGKDIRYPLAGHGLPALRHKAVLRKEDGYVLQAGIALGVEFKRGLHDLRARLMNDDGFPHSGQFPYSVIQDVQVTQDFSHRLFGLAEVVVENATDPGREFGAKPSIGISDNQVIIPALRKQDAENLKAALLQKMQQNPSADTGAGL